MQFRLAFICLALATLASANRGGVTAAVRSSVKDSTEYEVHLLVARHGLSCSDVMEKFISWYDTGREDLSDPLLSGLGRSLANSTGVEISQWLRSRNYELDAIMSSFLSRELETSIMMFQQQEQPLYVVPYVSYARGGPVNQPRERQWQLKKIRQTVPESYNFNVNYQWMSTFGSEETFHAGKYEGKEFEHFLEQTLLPEVIQATNKPAGHPIVLSLVTHSTFIKEAFGAQCGKLWDGKPEYNQVLDVKYKFRTTVPARGSYDVTARHTLTKVDSCETVSQGAQLTGDEKICLSDVGGECDDQIKKYSNYPSTLWEKTLEDEMTNVANGIHTTETDLKRAKQKLVLETDQYEKAKRIAKPQCKSSWSLSGRSCEPAALCEPSGLSCVVKPDVDADGLKKSIEQTGHDIAESGVRIMNLKSKFADLKKTPCRSGGFPDAARYVDFVGKDLPNRVLELVRG